MLLPRKRRTSRRHTSKRRQKLSNFSTPYQPLEQRNLLATFVVNTTADVVDAEDGLLSLREAVTAANTNEAFSDAPAGDVDGDRIVLAQDAEFARYVVTNGELTVTDDLVIQGNEKSSIHGAASNRLFNVSTAERVQFRNLLMAGGVTDGDGGLLNINPAGDVVIRDSILNGGVAANGGAINVVDSQLYVRGTTFVNNSAGNGGAIQASGSEVRLVGSSFLQNRADDSGGVVYATGGVLGLYGSTFGSIDRGNMARNAGGAIFVIGADDGDEGIFVSANSSFSSNYASSGGAIGTEGNTSAFILGSEFRSNGADENGASFTFAGGAIIGGGNGLYISESTFEGNLATQGAAVFSNANYSNFRGLTVTGNIASSTTSSTMGSGAGLLFIGDEAYVSDSTISENEAVRVGGGIAIGSGPTKVVLRRVVVADNTAQEDGGGISAGVDSTLRVFGSTVSGNIAGVQGGGVSAQDTDLLITGASVTGNEVTGLSGTGGGIAVSGGSTLVFNSTIWENVSNSGAGGFAVRSGYARLQDTDVVSNTARNSGGGLDARSSTLVLIGGEVSFNQATEAPPFGSRAGAVNMDKDARVFVRGGTRFESNTAEAFGGAIQVPGFLSVQDAVFVSNSAASGGAIFVFDDGSAYFERTQFVTNSAEEHGAAIFARGFGFLPRTTLIMTASVFENNEVTANESGFPVVVNEAVFWRESLGTFTGNSPNNEIGMLG